MVTLALPIDADQLRLRHEFLSMPGLTLTVSQTARLLDIRLIHDVSNLQWREPAMLEKRTIRLVPRIWIGLTAPIAITVVVASAAGAFWPTTYAKETAAWSAQGAGQDFANLFLIVPVFCLAHVAQTLGRSGRSWCGRASFCIWSTRTFCMPFTFTSARCFWST